MGLPLSLSPATTTALSPATTTALSPATTTGERERKKKKKKRKNAHGRLDRPGRRRLVHPLGVHATQQGLQLFHGGHREFQRQGHDAVRVCFVWVCVQGGGRGRGRGMNGGEGEGGLCVHAPSALSCPLSLSLPSCPTLKKLTRPRCRPSGVMAAHPLPSQQSPGTRSGAGRPRSAWRAGWGRL